MPRGVALGIGLSALAAAGPAVAQSNFRLAPVGGRTTLVGGTGMAFGRDGASAFLNPATAVRVDDNRLSFAVNFYNVNFVFAPRWYRPGDIDRARFGELDVGSASMVDVEFNALPSSLCLFFRVGDLPWFAAKASEDVRLRAARLGLCFATVQSQTFNFAAEQYDHIGSTGVTRQAQTLAQSYNRFSAGPTYAMSINDELSIGASLHGSFATHRGILASTATTYGSTPTPITSMFYNGARGDSFQFSATVGATYRVDHSTLALAVESPSVHVYGVGSANLSTHFEGAGSGSTVTAVSGSFVSRTPLRVSIGAGVEGRWGSVEVNASLHAPQSAYEAELDGRVINRTGDVVDDQPTTVRLSESTRTVVNGGVGAQLFVYPSVSLLGGLSTDFSAIGTSDLRGTLVNYFPSRTHRLGASFGVGSHGDGGDLLIGAEASLGWGDRLAVNSYQLPPAVGVTGHTTASLLFVIAGSTSLKAITRAVRDVKDVITDTKPAPRKE